MDDGGGIRMTTVVAIDGPAGSGKSSVSRAAARELGFDYLDTGAAYRALAWRCIEQGIDTHGPRDVIESLDSFEYSIGIDPDKFFVYEVYADEDAFAAHIAAPYGAPFNARLNELIVEPHSLLTFLTPIA